MKKTIYYTGLIFIAIFLFATHSKFLFILEPEKEIALFSFFGIDFKKYIPYIFGAAFGIVTAILIGLMQKNDKLFWHFAITIAVFEMIGIFLYNNTEIVKNIWKWFASSYYALYSGFIVFMYAYISHTDNDRCKIDELQEFENLIAPLIEKNLQENANDLHLQKDAKETRKEKILQMSETMKPTEIAKELGVNQSTVYRILKKRAK